MNVLAVSGKRTFIEELQANKKSRERVKLIVRAAERVARFGMDWAYESETFKRIDSGLSIFELRIKGKVIRVMTYIHNSELPVYLFDFDGHQGKRAHIPSGILERAKVLAKEARACCAAEGGVSL